MKYKKYHDQIYHSMYILNFIFLLPGQLELEPLLQVDLLGPWSIQLEVEVAVSSQSRQHQQPSMDPWKS